MNSQFSVKDYLNYTISGVLWMLILCYILFLSKIIDKIFICTILQIVNSNILGFVIILFGGYTLGNVLRFTDCIIKWFNHFLFGDLYSYALISSDTDGKEYGRIGNHFKSKRLSLGKKNSQLIEERLSSINIFRKDKKAQYILAENYLNNRINNKKIERMNDLKNFYDSISAPFFILLLVLLFETFRSDLICILKLLISAIILLVFYMFVERYRFLFSNYIKETYRCFLFL